MFKIERVAFDLVDRSRSEIRGVKRRALVDALYAYCAEKVKALSRG